jgi:pyridoxal phosphate enzyme (YggS family)
MTSDTTLRLTENLARIRSRIDAACGRSGRSASDVTLVAVTKYADLDWVRALVDLGITDLGESRPQQLAARAGQLPGLIRWHMIGHLQRNKVEQILNVATLIHSADSVRLLEAINKEASKAMASNALAENSTADVESSDDETARGARPKVLLEVNVSGEDSKDGFKPEDLLAAWPTIRQLQAISIVGLMTMAPLSENPESTRTVFRDLRRLRDNLEELSNGQARLTELSMGMSGDFEIAIEEGATLIRVGSGLFEGLQAEGESPSAGSGDPRRT